MYTHFLVDLGGGGGNPIKSDQQNKKIIIKKRQTLKEWVKIYNSVWERGALVGLL